MEIEGKNNSSLELAWKHLSSADFNFKEKFTLKLENKTLFKADRIMRVLPKKRLVALGTWQDKPSVIKMFFDPRVAKVNLEKEIAGINLLKKCNILTPTIYYQGMSEDRRIYTLISERIFAKNLEELWQNKHSIEEMMPIFKMVMFELATQHVFGIVQHDLHFKNFLIKDEAIYTIDGGQITFQKLHLSKQLSMLNLAQFLSMIGVGFKCYQEELFHYYREVRGWIFNKEDDIQIFNFINQCYRKRFKHFAKKILRENSNHQCFKYKNLIGMHDRSFLSAEIYNLLKHPDLHFQQNNTVFLKKGRSSTVIKVTISGKDYVIKRYNFKNLWHRIRRSMRSTRAAKSWSFAQQFALFGIATAKPLAFLEEKYLWLRGRSYYISEYIPGGHALEYFHKNQNDLNKAKSMVELIVQLLSKMADLRLIHGDLKITNILIDAKDKPAIIDFDGTRSKKFQYKFRSAWKKEIKRFMQNFQHQPWLAKYFANALDK